LSRKNQATPSTKRNWLRPVNEPQSEAEELALQTCIAREKPFGNAARTKNVARQLKPGKHADAARPTATSAAQETSERTRGGRESAFPSSALKKNYPARI
jgi:hypothetical protein